MRTLPASRFCRRSNATPLAVAARYGGQPAYMQGCRRFAQVKDLDRLSREVWFTSGAPKASPELLGGGGDHKPPDPRTLQLGKTVRVLHDRLPTLLQSPLPSDILSPRITLHLFPSTHPHLPTVSGRIAYIAALWTAPMAWGRVPLIGNVKLTVLSERMVRHGGSAVPLKNREEKLIVKWKTCGKGGRDDDLPGVLRDADTRSKTSEDYIAGSALGPDESTVGNSRPEEFCGMFIFEFDEAGRLAKHVIEHTEQGGDWDKMTRVVSVTDWLLGKFNRSDKGELPVLACCGQRERDGQPSRRFP